ncbi:EcoKI restriction-modification system protein HsdS [Gimesia panareensis]|uniref:EcoKI restriction-modification system protein HsdS n=1 Tax=Gimesia panareensis TaxID=2527978 RepID=A0A517QE20_9PLAN|nr:restriction endonuclease subunit S [Gimesia panareensis]QDT29882.1 EcoKI restriction-modification system protein HsdS [Gimesia panareensis]
MSVRTEKIGNVAKVFAGMPTKSSDREEIGCWGNVLTVRSLTGTGIDLTQLEEHGVAGQSIDQYKLHPNDVILSARSTSLKTAIIPQELGDRLINSTLIGVRCLSELHPRLLIAWLEGPEGQAALEAVSQSGTHQMNITVAGLSKIEVPVPPLETQQKMVHLLEAADEAYTSAILAAGDRRRIAREVVFNSMKETK